MQEGLAVCVVRCSRDGSEDGLLWCYLSFQRLELVWLDVAAELPASQPHHPLAQKTIQMLRRLSKVRRLIQQVQMGGMCLLHSGLDNNSSPRLNMAVGGDVIFPHSHSSLNSLLLRCGSNSPRRDSARFMFPIAGQSLVSPVDAIVICRRPCGRIFSARVVVRCLRIQPRP